MLFGLNKNEGVDATTPGNKIINNNNNININNNNEDTGPRMSHKQKINHILVSIGIEKQQFVFKRIGASLPRPVKIKFRTIAERDIVYLEMVKGRKSTAMEGLSFMQDLTPKQFKEKNALRQKLREKLQAGETNLVIQMVNRQHVIVKKRMGEVAATEQNAQ